MCDRTGEDDDDLINQQGCGKLYLVLEECLGEHERDWRKCQQEASTSAVPAHRLTCAPQLHTTPSSAAA